MFPIILEIPIFEFVNTDARVMFVKYQSSFALLNKTFNLGLLIK